MKSISDYIRLVTEATGSLEPVSDLTGWFVVQQLHGGAEGVMAGPFDSAEDAELALNGTYGASPDRRVAYGKSLQGEFVDVAAEEVEIPVDAKKDLMRDIGAHGVEVDEAVERPAEVDVLFKDLRIETHGGGKWYSTHRGFMGPKNLDIIFARLERLGYKQTKREREKYDLYLTFMGPGGKVTINTTEDEAFNMVFTPQCTESIRMAELAGVKKY